jgi:hypothetical protein
MNSYQKLKQKIKSLENDIYTLVEKKGTYECIMTEMRYGMIYAINEACMVGERKTDVTDTGIAFTLFKDVEDSPLEEIKKSWEK